MKKTTVCHCQSGCQNKSCTCLKQRKHCTVECGCSECKNPLNAIEDVEALTDCAWGHIRKVASLSESAFNQKYELPCGCEKVTLRELLSDYVCQKCEEVFYYSFCMNEVVYGNHTWHCSVCGVCADDGTWHCKNCNQCTYGLSLRCENCGRKSPFMP